MQLLELKGCGVLSEASINCPLLTSLDASFCRSCYEIAFPSFSRLLLLCLSPFTLFLISHLFLPSCSSWQYFLFHLCSHLKDECLSATATSCQFIGSLILMSCPSVGPDGLSSLSRLPYLTSLDLSYTFLTNLQPVFESCLQLKVLFIILLYKAGQYECDSCYMHHIFLMS